MLIRRIRWTVFVMLLIGWVASGDPADVMAQTSAPAPIVHSVETADNAFPSRPLDRFFWLAMLALISSGGLSLLLLRLIRRRRFLEQSLRETDEKWRSLMENVPDHIMLLDLDGHILFANRGFMGIEKPGLVGKPLARLVAPPFGATVQEHLKAVATGKASEVCRVESPGPQRARAFFELRMGPVRVNHQTVAVAVNSTEISARVRQERALAESEAFHRAFFENVPTGIAIQDFSAVETSVNQLLGDGVDDLKTYLEAHPQEVSRLAGQVTMKQVNPALLALYQATDAEAMIGTLAPMLKSDDRMHFIDQVVAFTRGQDHYEGEGRNVDQKGRTLHLIIRKVVVDRPQNGLSKILTCLIDITPLKMAEEEHRHLMIQLQQAQKMEAIGTLAGGVAHDFNNILSIILGNAEISMTDIPLDHPARLNLQEIQRASLRARDIVQQLLSISRKNETVLKPIHLTPIVAEAAKFLRATIPANIAIHTELSVEADVVRADATQIHQVMINLFTNASHAMEVHGGTLAVQAQNVTLDTALPGVIHPIPAGPYLRITVADTGNGIPEEIQGRIFEPYFTTKHVGKGTGMGLAMVQGIMKKSGGGIVLKTREGSGTTFELYFPLARSLAQESTVIETPLPRGAERILFVDDETMITTLSEKILTRLGYQVCTVNSPVEALTRIKADPQAFDLLITDMSMPAMTGDQLVEGVRKVRPEIPVILCTGYSNKITQEKITALSIGAVITKPVEVKKIAHTVRRLLDGGGVDR